MKNFLQFIIPILILCVIGCLMLLYVEPDTDHKKIYIKCNNSFKSYDIDSTTIIDFMPKSEECNLKIEMINVDRNYVKISTPYLWRLTFSGEIDEDDGPRTTHIVEVDQETVLYSFDKKTKFTFQYK